MEDMVDSMLRTVRATRYVSPLREGGSLPAIVEADDEGLYVVKFRGAGQGPRALIAELLAGEIGRALGLLIPEIVFIEVDPVLGRAEPDSEIQSLLKASGGLNLALDFLPGALPFGSSLAQERFGGPASSGNAHQSQGSLASEIVWFDAFVTNVDRTPKNPNLLLWHRRLWLIDHGAALYFHHTWKDYLARARSGFPQVKEHVLLPFAGDLPGADARLSARLTSETLESIVDLIPDDWLESDPHFVLREQQRMAYLAYLQERLHAPRRFVEEAQDARRELV
jgi:hypothetical protein